MKIQGAFVLAAVIMMFSLCNAHIGGSVGNQISMLDVEPQAYCGRALSRIIGQLCFGLPLNDKRAMSSSMYNTLLSQYYKEQESQSGWPWISHRRANSMSLPSRDKRYVVTECCEKACSVTELMSYC